MDKEGNMPIKKYTAEQIIGMLREAEILLADGDTIAAASRKLGYRFYVLNVREMTVQDTPASAAAASPTQEP
jgi:hypothetical protein